MKREFFLFYTEANIVCILLFGILLLNDRISMNKQEKQLIFDRALVAHILYFFESSLQSVGRLTARENDWEVAAAEEYG